MNQRKRKSLRGRLARLAKNNCANYKANPYVECELTMCKLCVVQIETDSMVGNVCPYFMRNVLPAEPKLMNEYLDYFPQDYPLKKKRRNMKSCGRCSEEFEAKSNRAKYCIHCRKVVKREQTVLSNRNSGK
jgi:hypothetical protein